MSKPWGGAGAWALDAERAEEEKGEQAAVFPSLEAPAPAGGDASFPSLREAAAAGGGGKSKKKNKGTTLSLSEFTTFGAAVAQRRAAPVEPRGLTPDEMMMLPTGPRERSAEELDSSRGFRSYGGGGFGGPGGGEGRRGFDDEGRRGSGRSSDLDMPSRADEVDDWGAGKKFTPAATDSGRRDRFGGPSPLGRADDIDDWSRDKKPLPSRYPSLGSGGGGGFRSSLGGFRDSPASSDSDRWVRGATPMPHNGEGAGERPRIVLNPPKRDPSATTTPPAEAAEVARSRPSPFGAARPREDVLSDKGVDWRKMESEIEQPREVIGDPSSTTTPPAEAAEAEVARSRPNPFGAARPREDVLADKGVDWRKIESEIEQPREVVLQEKEKDWRKVDLELEHHVVNRPESDEERNLKEEINLMKVDLKEIEGKISDDSDQASIDAKNLSEKISQLESQLEQLTRELDEKIQFGQRPRSGAGRVTAPPPTSLTEEPQATAVERPRSRGCMEPHSRPEERWGFQGSRERGSFGGIRSSDRSMTRQRW